EYEVLNVGDINKLFPKGGDVGIDELVASGAVRKNSLIKVLGDGKLTVKVNVTAHKFSGSAREKITSAGGSCTEAAGGSCTEAAGGSCTDAAVRSATDE
ncbi:MAG: uL15 family ribosomal protein, partial [Mycobacterium sp.]